MDTITAELEAVKKEIRSVEADLAKSIDAEEKAYLRSKATQLREEKKLLLQAMLARPPANAAAHAAGPGSLGAGENTIKVRSECSSKYAAHIEDTRRGCKESAIVVGERHVATYAHGRQWQVAEKVEVFVHDSKADRRQAVSGKAVVINPHIDLAILEVDTRLAAPVLDAQLSAGTHYYTHGQSTQAQGDASSTTHGVIAATELDAHSHVRGDAIAGAGDSGAGVFSVKTGKLMGMIVGFDEGLRKTVLVPSGTITALLASVPPPKAAQG